MAVEGIKYWDSVAKTFRTTSEVDLFASDVKSVNGQVGDIVLTKTDVGLGSVDNTPDASKPVSGPQADLIFTKFDKAGGLITGSVTIDTGAASPGAGQLVLSGSGTNGAVFKFVGNGAITPSKTMRSADGAFQIINDAFSGVIFTIDDFGNTYIPGAVNATRAFLNGPVRFGQFVLAALPSAAAFAQYMITVTDATGGPKLCVSDGANWKIINTTTTVS